MALAVVAAEALFATTPFDVDVVVVEVDATDVVVVVVVDDDDACAAETASKLIGFFVKFELTNAVKV